YVLTCITHNFKSLNAPRDLDPVFVEGGGEAYNTESRSVRLFSTFERATAVAATLALGTQQLFDTPFISSMFLGHQMFGYLIFDQTMNFKRQLWVVAKVVDGGEEYDGARSMSSAWGT
ncbi:MAG: hypothetical protein Q9193_005298, partial [Seirophora villosa]